MSLLWLWSSWSILIGFTLLRENRRSHSRHCFGLLVLASSFIVSTHPLTSSFVLTWLTIWLMAWRTFFLLEPLLVRILVLSFLFKWESFSFVRGLWLLNLDNRKKNLVDIFGSPLHPMFFDGDWKIFCFLSFEYLFWDLYIFQETFSCLQEGNFNLGVFAGMPQLAWLGCVLYQGVFISINVIYDLILLLSVDFSFFSWCSKSDMVDVCCAWERVQWLLGEKRWA